MILRLLGSTMMAQRAIHRRTGPVMQGKLPGEVCL
jgi:hypothetical protein